MGLRRREPLPHIDAPTFSGSARTVLYTERNSLLQPATSTEDSTIPAINATYFSVLKLCSRTELKDWKRCAHIPLRWRQQMNTPLYWHQNKSRNAGALSVTRKRPSVYASTKNSQSPITLIISTHHQISEATITYVFLLLPFPSKNRQETARTMLKQCLCSSDYFSIRKNTLALITGYRMRA